MGGLPRRKAANIPPVNREKRKRAIKDKERDREKQGKVTLRQRRQVTELKVTALTDAAETEQLFLEAACHRRGTHLQRRRKLAEAEGQSSGSL